VRALFEAQVGNTTPAPAPARTTLKTLTMDQIAAMSRRAGLGSGLPVDEGQGLVIEKTSARSSAATSTAPTAAW